MRSNSTNEVSIVGTGSPTWPARGPREVSPTNAAVLVPTPSIDLARKLVSSTNTPGARYSGMEQLLGLARQGAGKRDPADHGARHSTSVAATTRVESRMFTAPAAGTGKASASASGSTQPEVCRPASASAASTPASSTSVAVAGSATAVTLPGNP